MTNYAIIVGVTGMSELRPDKLLYQFTVLESTSLSAPIKEHDAGILKSTPLLQYLLLCYSVCTWNVCKIRIV